MRSIAQSLYRERRKVYPILPKSREDVHAALDSMAILTSKDEEFVQVNSIETGIVILSCLSNLKFLVNSVEEIFIDGTFKCCPKYFYQLYTIHGLINKKTRNLNAHMIVLFPRFRRKKRAYDISIRANVKRSHIHAFT